MKSIQSFFRILAFNPYNVKNENPYKDLPFNFLFYNMAYPVRYDGSQINIAKNSMGLNLRIYSLSNGALLRLISPNTQINIGSAMAPNYLTWKNFDVLRELYYYEYIRDMIIKRNVSPNFITLFFYKLDSESKIDYQQLSDLINNHITNDNFIDLILKNQEPDYNEDNFNKSKYSNKTCYKFFI